MRIIAGQFRGRPLQTPRGDGTRPTSGRIRDALMQMLANRTAHLHSPHPEHAFRDLHVLDLFCGSGALGLEAISRGAPQATFIDSSADAIRATTSNIQSLGCTGSSTILRGKLPNALRRIDHAPFHLVFADPPYAFTHFNTILAELVDRDLLAPGALVVYEHATGATAPAHPVLAHEALRSWGDTTMTLYTAPMQIHPTPTPLPQSPSRRT